MRAIKSLLLAGESLIDRVLCVVGAVAFSQAPEFMQQYLQRLGGHLAEARRQLSQFEDIARQAGRSLQDLAGQYQVSGDTSISALGKLMTRTQQRVDELAAAETALRQASVWTRPFVFLRNLDSEIAQGTAGVFRPAVPTTAEGLLYALAGIVVILALYHGVLKPLVQRLCGRRVDKPVRVS
mgnify:CR=1 FL=1